MTGSREHPGKAAGPDSTAERRRQQILDAAAACFVRRGFHGAGMAEIARTFGMSAGHIYNYFASKEAIIEALVARDLETALASIESLRSTAEILHTMLAGVAEGVDSRVAHSSLELEIIAEAARNPRVAATVQAMDAAVRARLVDVLAGAGLPGVADADDAAARVEVLLAIFDGLMIRVVRHPGFDRAAVVRVVQDVMRGFFRREAGGA